MAIQAIGRYLWRIYLIGTSHTIARDLRKDLYAHLQRLPLQYYQRVRTGDLMSRATNGIDHIGTFAPTLQHLADHGHRMLAV